MASMLELKKITKRYGDTFANREISLSIDEGEVYCLLGENGAGKSTLMNVLYGLTRPDHGEILMDGQPVSIHSPRDAIRCGIGMVHQHFMLIPALTVLENIVLASDEYKRFFVKKEQVAARIREISERYGFHIDPDMRVYNLSVGQQQRVEIVKAIYHHCRLLILDEPTAVLTPHETEELYGIIEQFKAEQKSVIFISHKLHEVMHVSDRISVLRNGESVATLYKKDTNEGELTAYMVGKPMDLTISKCKSCPREVVLQANGLKVRSRKGNLAVKDLSVSVRGGEIYGIAGVDGNGQSELIQALTGLRRAEGGSVKILGNDTLNATPGRILELGVSHIPEDRQHMGIAMNQSLMNNLILYDYRNPEYRKGCFLDWGKERRHAKDLIEKYRVKAPGITRNISYLSGGNQQKAVVARELDKNPKLLLAVYPTRGVDIGAVDFIHKEIVKARDSGCAVLLVSSELDEILTLSDRVGVIFDGTILGEMDREDATIERIGMYMAGVSGPVVKEELGACGV